MLIKFASFWGIFYSYDPFYEQYLFGVFPIDNDIYFRYNLLTVNIELTVAVYIIHLLMIVELNFSTLSLT